MNEGRIDDFKKPCDPGGKHRMLISVQHSATFAPSEFGGTNG
jgi:hypothetical protein